jgi:outer membrane protein OmpA-like peptidoglycan-associated protein
MSRLARYVVVALGIFGFTPILSAQSLLHKIKDKAQEKIDRTTDKIASCAVGDDQCIQKAKQDGKAVKVTDAEGKPVSTADSAKAMSHAGGGGASGDAAAPAEPAAADPPGKGAWLNYDFVPGDRTIWYEDFSGDAVGDFPQRMKLKDGNLEVIDLKGKHYLRSADGGAMMIKLPEQLPERYTVELSYHSPTGSNPLWVRTSDGETAQLGCYPTSAFVEGGGGPRSGSEAYSRPPNGFVTCRFTVDTRYVKGYVDEHRTANAPGSVIVRTDTLFLQIPGGEENDPSLLGWIRVAAGGKKLYDRIMADGRATTRGIYFDTGSDQLRGESTPTLKEIGDMLAQHSDLKLLIEGHTDNVGSSAANLALSDRRAAAVKQYLVANFGIAAARLTTKGYGDTQPVAKNDTAEGRQNNRRVELVKQ